MAFGSSGNGGRFRAQPCRAHYDEGDEEESNAKGFHDAVAWVELHGYSRDPAAKPTNPGASSGI